MNAAILLGIAAFLYSTESSVFFTRLSIFSAAVRMMDKLFYSYKPRCRSPPFLHFRFPKIMNLEDKKVAGFKYCFIKENNEYREIPYSDLSNNGKRNPEYAGRYFIPCGNSLLEVSYSSYLAEHKRRRRVKYLREEAISHREVSYHSLDTDEFSGEEIVSDTGDSVEYIAIRGLMIQKLRLCLEILPEEERELLTLRYFEQRTESACADIYAVNQSTISRRERKILKKLQKLLKT